LTLDPSGDLVFVGATWLGDLPAGRQEDAGYYNWGPVRMM